MQKVNPEKQDLLADEQIKPRSPSSVGNSFLSESRMPQAAPLKIPSEAKGGKKSVVLG